MSEAFSIAAEEVKVLKQTPKAEEVLLVYGLYKQTLEGDVNIDRPGMFSVMAKQKWDAWNEQKGLSQEEARAQYIKLVEELKEKYGI